MSGKGRAPKGSVRRKQRKKDAVVLEAEGKSEREIAAILNVSKSEAHRLLAEANAEARPDPVLVEARRNRIRNIVDAQVSVWAPKALKNRNAALVLTKLLDRLAKLDGIDAPAKVDVTLAEREHKELMARAKLALSPESYAILLRVGAGEIVPSGTPEARSGPDSGHEGAGSSGPGSEPLG